MRLASVGEVGDVSKASVVRLASIGEVGRCW